MDSSENCWSVVAPFSSCVTVSSEGKASVLCSLGDIAAVYEAESLLNRLVPRATDIASDVSSFTDLLLS